MHGNKEQLERILAGCRRNERAAQKELYRNYYGHAMSIALRYSSGHNNAIEMTNNAFLKVFKGLKDFVPRDDDAATSFIAWLKKMVVNACIDHIRKYHKKELMATMEIGKTLAIDQREAGKDILPYKKIIKCIQLLPPAYRVVFNLYLIEGFTHAEIADKLSISEGASRSNLFRARQHLQSFYKEQNTVNHKSIIATALR